MTYNLEKYRDKREKVLGVKKRNMSFGILATIVSLIIIVGFSVAVIPKSIAYFRTRNLDDAIFKLKDDAIWPTSIIVRVQTLKGVKNVSPDKKNTRLVVTFDRMEANVTGIMTLFKNRGLKPVMLNRVSHNQRTSTLKEEAEFEAL